MSKPTHYFRLEFGAIRDGHRILSASLGSELTATLTSGAWTLSYADGSHSVAVPSDRTLEDALIELVRRRLGSDD